jgi:hypothetical protein
VLGENLIEASARLFDIARTARRFGFAEADRNGFGGRRRLA